MSACEKPETAVSRVKTKKKKKRNEKNPRDILKRIAQAVRKVISRVNPPRIARPMMRGLQDPIRSQIPHLWIPVLQILLHSQHGLLGLILPIPHCSKLGQGFLNGSVAVLACKSWASVLPSTLLMDLCSGTMAYVCPIALDQVLRKIVQFLKVIAGIGNLERLEA